MVRTCERFGSLYPPFPASTGVSSLLSDLKFVHAPKFDGEQDMEIHARTKMQFHRYSYVESAAIRIGEDVLEVGSFGEYAVNGVDEYLPPFMTQPGKLRENVYLTSLGGYPVYHTRVKNKDTFDVVVGQNENVTLTNLKQFVSVKFHNFKSHRLEDATGLMGSWEGKLLARDGVTDMSSDPNAYGQEWQVRADEPKLFVTDREPQSPKQCRMPELAISGRRLGEGNISEESAEAACAHVNGKDFDNCVSDVIFSGDVDIAGVY